MTLLSNPNPKPKPYQSFFSCDWGTTSFRLRVAERDGETWRVRETLRSDRGVRSFQGENKDAFPAYLKAMLMKLSTSAGLAVTLPVVISGMASANVGWLEVPYAATPFPVLDGRAVQSRTCQLDAWDAPVLLISGLSTGVDIMRGEESELLGIFSHSSYQSFARDGCAVILPGTHSKHVYLRGGDVVDFTTYMTGELYDLLSHHSLLRTSMSVTMDPEIDTDCSALREGARAASASGLSKNLFRVRTRDVLGKIPPSVNTQFLRGLLLGAELVDLLNQQTDSPILLAGGPAFLTSYQVVLDELGLHPDRLIALPVEHVEMATVLGHAQVLATS